MPNTPESRHTTKHPRCGTYVHTSGHAAEHQGHFVITRPVRFPSAPEFDGVVVLSGPAALRVLEDRKASWYR